MQTVTNSKINAIIREHQQKIAENQKEIAEMQESIRQSAELIDKLSNQNPIPAQTNSMPKTRCTYIFAPLYTPAQARDEKNLVDQNKNLTNEQKAGYKSAITKRTLGHISRSGPQFLTGGNHVVIIRKSNATKFTFTQKQAEIAKAMLENEYKHARITYDKMRGQKMVITKSTIGWKPKNRGRS